MTEITTLSKAWQLLDQTDKGFLVKVLLVQTTAAVFSSIMVGSILPFLSVLSDATQIQKNSTFKFIYEEGNFVNEYTFLIALGLVSLTIIIITNSIQILKVWYMSVFTSKLIHKISFNLFKKYLNQPYEYYLQEHTGNMGSHILSESQEIVNQFFRPFLEVVASLLTITTIILLLFWIEPLVATTVFITLSGIYCTLLLFFRNRIKIAGQIRAESNRNRFRLTSEALGGIKEIKLRNSEGRYFENFQILSQAMVKSLILIKVLGQTPQYILQAVGFGGLIIFCLIVVDPIEFSKGDALKDIVPVIGLFAFAGQKLLPEISRTYQGLTLLNTGGVVVNKIHAEIHKGLASLNISKESEDVAFTRDIQVQNLSYTYPSGEAVSLENVTFNVKSGERLGIVGKTGSGKTTLVNLVLGFLNPDEGGLLVDNNKISENNLRSWQNLIGYVPQDIFLADTTVAENIAFGLKKSDIDFVKLSNSIKVAQLDDLIKNLPDGLNTVLGERGVRLSGGQKQRIAIARALYHDAKLIILDEATSALDSITEQELINSIDNISEEKTVITIAHRLNTIKNCDSIIVLKDGCIVGNGTWESLIASCPEFQDITSLGQTS